MDSSARFRSLFAHRLGSAIGLGALLLPAIYACSGKAVVDSSGGTGGASSSNQSSSNQSSSNQSSNSSSNQVGVGGNTSSTSTGGCVESTTTSGGGPTQNYHYTMCLDDVNLPCPGDEEAAFDALANKLNSECCVEFDSCEWLLSVDCGPFVSSLGQCCFEISTEDNGCAVPGRPFSDCGEALLAPREDTSGWLARIDALRCDALSPAERKRLADKWAADGLAEHASVASFSRFALQLMAVGAPAELVAAAQAAALDEVEHARLAFAVASAYADKPVGPGRFPIPETPIATGLVELAVATAEEGCINETLSTLDAYTELTRTTDPVVRAVLERIIADETRHAELAWQTVAWALSVGGPEVRTAVEAVFARAATSNQTGMRDVIQPVANALLAA